MTGNAQAIWALLPAAGQGRRAGEGLPKQYRLLDHKPVICQTIERLLAIRGLCGLIVGISAADKYWQTVHPRHPLLLEAYPGGAERADTVLLGLQALRHSGAQGADWVLVHDAVRPCVRVSDIHVLLQTLQTQGVDGGLLAVPVSDTIKLAGAKLRVEKTLPRSQLWRALTPQCFRLEKLESALLAAASRATRPTDEAEALEWAGSQPLLVHGHTDNIKITYAEDLLLAEHLLRLQREPS